MDNNLRRRLPSLLVALLGLVALLAMTPAPAGAADGDRLVRVGTEGTYPPFTYTDPRSQQLTGYDIEVMEAVAKKAGWRLDFVSPRSTPSSPPWTPSGST